MAEERTINQVTASGARTPNHTAGAQVCGAMDIRPYPQASGLGTEASPFVTTDGTAGIQAVLDAVSQRGGRVLLPSGRYDITQTSVIRTPCTWLDGAIWSYNADPNGVFESQSGTKLRLRCDIPALTIGAGHTAEGCMLSNFGVQGNIPGMDTRPLFGHEGPCGGTGVRFAGARVDQGELRKLSFCGLGCGVYAARDAEIDACTFEKLNFDGCAVGVWMTPGAAFYPMFRHGLYADNPYYAFFADGTGIEMHNLMLENNLFIRSGGAFQPSDGWEPAAVYWRHVQNSLIRDNLFDDVGTFWYFADDACQNTQRQPTQRQTTGLVVIGSGNRIIGNVFKHSSGAAIRVIGDDNVLLNNISDADIIVTGRRNQVLGTVLTNPSARLIVSDAPCETQGSMA